MEFKGFDDWVEIFRGGPVTDSAGIKHDGNKLIADAVSKFNAAEHEPPVVVGHPKTDAPAFGWVKGVKVRYAPNGQPNGHPVLMVKFGDVNPDFAALVQAGAYKKRSAAFYPDGRLRHVGFLGAAPPAIKGLADLKFSEDAGATFEFSDYSDSIIRRVFSRLRDWFVEKEGAEKADNIISTWDIEDLTRKEIRDEMADNAAPEYAEGKTEGEEPMADEKKAVTFSEAEVERFKAEALEAGKKAAAAEFAEKERVLIVEAEKKSFAEFVEAGIASGKIPPAWKKQGMVAFADSLIEGAPDTPLTFAEGGTPEKPISWFRRFVESLPQIIPQGEFAAPGTDPGGYAESGDTKIVAIVRARMEKDGISFGDAYDKCAAEAPAVFEEYLNK